MANPVFYQVFIQSFKDSNGDGWGDLQGIIEKLPYIAGLGVEGIWITPIYTSPMHDNGYDVADYRAINPRYGSMADAEQLISHAHKAGLKVLLDLVVNHTSTEHEWFKKSCQHIEPYTNYYIWRKKPNNWQSIFGGSAWQHNTERGDYYLHLFAKEQADLNWDNPLVRDEVKKIIEFWVEKGIDGFRLDVINLISKDPTFPNDDESHGAKYYTDGPRVLEYFSELGKTFKKHDLFTIGELFVSDIEHSANYTRPSNQMLSSIFSLKHLTADWPNEPYGSDPAKFSNTPFSLPKMKKIISQWQVGMQEKGGVLSPCWGNHDQPRIVSRFGSDSEEYCVLSAKMLAIGQFFLPGIPFIFQGEELGMANYPFKSLDDFKDVETLGAISILRERGYDENSILKLVNKGSREHAHAPMQWDSSANAGFSTGKPWRSVNPNYKVLNAQQQQDNPQSVLNFYRKILAIRQSFKGLNNAIFSSLNDEHPHLWVYCCVMETEKILVICNFSDTKEQFTSPLLNSSQLVIANYSDSLIIDDVLTVRPYEAAIFKIK